MAGLKTSAALVCTKGCVRGNNEDNFFFQGDYLRPNEMDGGARIIQEFDDTHQLFAICDGMGGEASGERASFLAVELMAQSAGQIFGGSMAQALDRYARRATELIWNDAQRHNTQGMGTTLAALAINGDSCCVSNVGDSRIYLLRASQLTIVSRDQTMVYSLYLNGTLTLEQARKHPQNNVISQFLGMNPAQLPEVYTCANEFRVCRGDRFMLCSDGVCDLLSQKAISTALRKSATPIEAAETVVLAALEMGGKDNTTCIVVDLLDPRLPNPPQGIGPNDDMTTQ